MCLLQQQGKKKRKEEQKQQQLLTVKRRSTAADSGLFTVVLTIHSDSVGYIPDQSYIFIGLPVTSCFLWLFCPSGGVVGPPEAGEPTPGPEPTPEEDPAPRPSKRLTVLTQCVWTDEAERSRVLKVLCQRMALNRLDRPFWVGRHLIRPASRHVESESGSADCVHYKIHVSAPERRRPARPPPTSTSLQQVEHTCVPV